MFLASEFSRSTLQLMINRGGRPRLLQKTPGAPFLASFARKPPTLSHGIPDLGLPHPFDCAQGRLFPRFLREGGSSARTTICRNARQASPLSKPALPAFHHV